MSVDRVIIRLTDKKHRIVMRKDGMTVEYRHQGAWFELDGTEYPPDLNYIPSLIDIVEAAEAMIAAQARDLRESLKPDTATEF